MNPLILSFLASISTIIGLLFIKIKNTKNILCFAFSFSSGVMITVSLFDLIPESFIKLNMYFNIFPSIIILLIFFSVGIIISMLIDKYIPSSDQIYRVGVISMIAIIIHNIPEGIATYIAGSVDIKLGINLSLSIALHNIPEGIIIALPIYYSTKSKSRAIIYTMIAGMSEFIGSLFSFLFLKDVVNNLFIGLMLSMIAGIMIQISFYELIPNTLKIKSRGIVGYFILGTTVMLLSIILI